MRSLFLFIFLSLSIIARSQDDTTAFRPGNVNVYVSFRPDDYSDENKETVHRLREFIENKNADLDDILKEIITREHNLSIIDTYAARIYLSNAGSNSGDEVVDPETMSRLAQFGYMSAQYKQGMKFKDLNMQTETIRFRYRQFLTESGRISVLNSKRSVIAGDVKKAQFRLDEVYGKVFDESVFRSRITAFFSCVVGALLLFFFVFITRKSDSQLARDFLSSGNGLQFITLFSLITAIILFGVLGILEGRELAAILSGISGYILGKGINNPFPTTPKTNAADNPDTKTPNAPVLVVPTESAPE